MSDGRLRPPVSRGDAIKRLKSFSSGLDWSFAVMLVLGIVSAGIVLWREGGKVFLDVLLEDSLLFASIVPKVIAGTLIGALVRILAPKKTIGRLIGEGSGIFGLMVALLAGILFPGGPYTIFPLAAAFMAAGADRGTIVTFVTAWLMIGFNRAVIWEMPFFGAEIVGLRNFLSLPFPLLAGFLARLMPRGVFGPEGKH